MLKSHASDPGRQWGRSLVMMLALAPLAVLPPHAIALPTGGRVVAGDVSITSAGAHMDITQRGRAGIVNWADFGIGAGGVVNIHQAADAALLNRVVGANPSQLLGQLNAAGRVYLINPNGVLVGADARIDAGSFFATTAQIGDVAFLAGGDLAFSGGTEAGIVNLGVIRAAAGDAVLVAHRVVNAGEIHAPAGMAALGAATEFIYSPLGDQRMRIVTSAAGEASAHGTGVHNSGLVDAAEARLQAANGNLYELAVNQTGVVRATGVETRGGRVLLTATGGTVAVTGNLTARNADGSGGEVLVGGDFQGANAAVPNVAFTRVGAEVVIDVAATSATGDGGRAIVWADGQTDFAGRIAGQGGARGGDGAFTEVSGKRILNYSGLADLSAPFGSTGTLWLDPDEAIISAAADDQANGIFNNTVLSNNLATANVIVDASGFGDGDGFKIGDITVNAPVTWTSGNTLTLKAGDRIAVNANLSGGNGNVVFQAAGVSHGNTIAVNAAATITAASLTIGQNPDAQFVGLNPLPESHRNLQGINIAGVLNVGTLDIRTENAGISGDISIANAANSIGTLASSATAGTINGNITIVGGAGDLTLTGNFAAVAAGKSTTLSTGGALTLAPGAAVASGANANVVLAAGTGAFTNNAGAGAITVGAGGRSLIYSNNPGATTLGGLTATPVYNKTFAANAPGTITQTGNRVLYGLAPTITFTAGDAARLYGAENPALSFTATGLVGGDTAAQAFTGSPVLSTTATAASNAGNYAIAVAAGTVVASDYDYQIAFAPGTLTVNPAPLTITAENKAKPQGDANPALTATFSGFVNGDTSAAITGLVLNTTAEAASPAGTYPIVPSGATSANYTISFVNGVLTVNSLPALIITANSFDIRYGAPLPTFTASITGFGGGDDASIVSGLTLTSLAGAGSGVGSYAIVPANATAAGYEISYVNGTLRIDPALLTITANSFNRFYGTDNPPLSASFAGFVNGETTAVLSGLTFATAATAASDVGDYPITPTGATAPNYDITFVPGTLTVNRAPLTLNVDNLSKAFGDPNPTFTATATGLVLGQALADLGALTLATTATQLTGVGAVPITASLVGAGVNNYTPTINPGTLTITPRPVTARVGSGTREYGDANPTITLGLFGTDPVGSPNFILNNVVPGTVSTTATPTSNVGTYPTTVSDMSAANPNFAITVEAGTLTVTPAPLTVRANNAARLYGAANPTFTGTATGLKLSDTLADVVDGSSFATIATPASNVGTYAITGSGTALSNNYALIFQPGTLTVNRAPLFVVPALASRLYGDPDPIFAITATGLRNGDTEAVVTQRSFSGSAPSAGVGSQPITILAATATNYNLTFGTGTLNILPRPLTITANNFTREYGEANPAFTASFAGLASFDPQSVITGLAFSTPATAASSVIPGGGYGINVTSNANPNYAITYAPGTLTVTPAPLLVNLSSITREYGGTTPTPTATVTTGFKNGDTIGMLGLSYAQLALPTADVGTFAYGASASNPNYNVVFTGGTQTITPAPLTVRVADVFRAYGDDNPANFTVNLDGLKFPAAPADIVAINNVANFSSGVGVYPFTAQLLTGNYTLSGLSGNLTVTPRIIDVLATASRVYGDPNPAASEFTLSGDFVNGDRPADVVGFFSYGNPVAVSANVGDYDISSTARYLAADPNYVIRSFAGTLSVAPRPLFIDIADIERFYGDPSPPVVLIGDPNLVPALDARDEVLRITAPDERAVPGNYPVEVEIINPNYTVGQLGFGRISILPRPLSITVNNATRIYGDDNPVFTASYGGVGLPSFVDPATFLDFSTVVPTDARTGTGHYLISGPRTGFNSSLYNVFDFIPGILTILPRSITLEVDDVTFFYPTNTDLEGQTDFSDVPFTASATNLVAGDTVATAFPNLVFEVPTNPTTGQVAAPVQPATYTPPPVAALVAAADTGGGGSDGGTISTFIPLVVEGLPAPELNTSIPLAPSTFSLTIDVQLTPTFRFGTGRTERTLERTVVLTGGYLDANPNYVVTAVNPGVITMTSLTLTEDELTRIDVNNLYPDRDTGRLVVRGLSDYRENVGVLFVDFPELAETMIMDYFAGLFASGEAGENELLAAIFGEGVTGMGGINPAALRAWLRDIDQDPAKRVLLAAPFANYARSLQGRDPSTYTRGESLLVEALQAQVQEERAKVAETVRDAQNAWLADKASSYGLADTFDGTQPYGDFIMAGIENYLVEAMSGGAIGAVIGGAAAGVAAATGAAAVGGTTAVSAAIFPYHFAKASAVAAGAAAKIGSPVLTAAGPAGIIVLAVTMSIVRGIQLGENMKEQKDFDAITGSGGGSFATMDLSSPEPAGQALVDQVIFGAALNNMLGGG